MLKYFTWRCASDKIRVSVDPFDPSRMKNGVAVKIRDDLIAVNVDMLYSKVAFFLLSIKGR